MMKILRKWSMTRRRKRRRCSLYVYLYLFVLFIFSTTFFVRNETYLRGLNAIDVISANIVFSDDSAKVVDAYKLTKKERYETAIYIDYYWKNEGYHFRSIESIEAEIYAHRIAYLLGIDKNRSKDADIDLKEDKRLYVKASYIALMAFGG